MLRTTDNYNNISPQLREKLNALRKDAGKIVKYKFYIAQRNPDGERRAADEHIWPATYTLTPVQYAILDPGDQLMKDIGMTDGLKRLRGDIQEYDFRRLQIRERDRGILSLDLTKPDQIEKFEFLEMHPKLEGGMFRDTSIPAMFVRLDELRESKTRLKTREKRSEALMVATRLTEDDVRSFAAGMNWNETDDIDILRDKLTSLADTDPEFFRKYLDDPRTEYKTTTRRAIDANIIAWIPVENKFIWTTNGNTIALLERADDKDFLDRMADWFMSHKNGQETMKKIKALLAK